MDSDTSFDDTLGQGEVDLRTPNLCDTPNYLVNIINKGKQAGKVIVTFSNSKRDLVVSNEKPDEVCSTRTCSEVGGLSSCINGLRPHILFDQ
jgi:hypothetical protein